MTANSEGTGKEGTPSADLKEERAENSAAAELAENFAAAELAENLSAGEEPKSLVASDAAEAVEESAAKPDAPASEVAEFQDAATSMGAMSSDVPGHAQVFAHEEQQAEVEETIVEGRQNVRPSRRGRGGGRRGSARDILLMEVPERAARAHQNLREQLRGTVLVRINDGRENYLLDWRGDQPSMKEAEGEVADCTIALHEKDLELIASGGLNPQIAMLSEKIQVSGNPCFAMYFFNLVAPPAVH